MIRVVLDTNVIVSALLNPFGPLSKILELAIKGSIQLCITAEAFEEYEAVIRRPRFRLSEETCAAALKTIRDMALWVRATERIRVCLDSDDDAFLECALAAKAEYLITGNLKDFPAGAWEGIRILTVREAVEILAGRGPALP